MHVFHPMTSVLRAACCSTHSCYQELKRGFMRDRKQHTGILLLDVLWHFIVSGLTFRSSTHLDLIFVYGVRQCSILFYIQLSSFPSTTYGKDGLFSVVCSLLLCHGLDDHDTWVYVYCTIDLYFILMCMVFVPTQYCLDSCSFVVVWSGSLIPLFFFLKLALAIWDILCFHTNSKIFCSHSVKNAVGNWQGCIECVDCFGWYRHFHNIESSHSRTWLYLSICLCHLSSVFQFSEYRFFFLLGQVYSQVFHSFCCDGRWECFLNFFLIFCLLLVQGREGNGTPTQYSCLENPMDRGAWQAAVHEVAKIGHD